MMQSIPFEEPINVTSVNGSNNPSSLIFNAVFINRSVLEEISNNIIVELKDQ